MPEAPYQPPLNPGPHCTGGFAAAVDNSEALWASQWTEDRESGACTGLTQVKCWWRRHMA